MSELPISLVYSVLSPTTTGGSVLISQRGELWVAQVIVGSLIDQTTNHEQELIMLANRRKAPVWEAMIPSANIP